jgi:uncharacterized membrane protein YdcZ (DUF606 family)
MLGYFFLSLVVGAFGVLQNTINRKIAVDWGIPLTLVVNGAVILSLSLVVFFLLTIPAQNSLPEFFRPRTSLAGFSWLVLVPGVLGYAIVIFVPFAVSQLGATRVFIAIIAAQIVVSMLWDRLYEGIIMSPQRLVGAALAFIGALLTLR